MRYLVTLLLIGSPMLAACQKADAMTNQEIAQCAGAMGLQREYILRQSQPRYDLIPPLTAGVIYYKSKLSAAGGYEDARADLRAFVDENYRNHQLIGETVKSCGHKLWAIPEFRDNYEALISFAISQDPACRADPSVCTKR